MGIFRSNSISVIKRYHITVSNVISFNDANRKTISIISNTVINKQMLNLLFLTFKNLVQFFLKIIVILYILINAYYKIFDYL